MAFSPDGKLLASSSADQILKLLDTTVGALEQTVEGHSGWFQSAVFPPDSRLFASGSQGPTMRLWDTATGTLRQTFNVNRVINDLECAQNGSYPRMNLRSLDVQFGRENHAPPNSTNVNIE